MQKLSSSSLSKSIFHTFLGIFNFSSKIFLSDIHSPQTYLQKIWIFIRKTSSSDINSVSLSRGGTHFPFAIIYAEDLHRHIAQSRWRWHQMPANVCLDVADRYQRYRVLRKRNCRKPARSWPGPALTLACIHGCSCRATYTDAPTARRSHTRRDACVSARSLPEKADYCSIQSLRFYLIELYKLYWHVIAIKEFKILFARKTYPKF